MLIRISNIDRSTSVDDIWDLFAEFGDVEEAELNDMPDPGKFTFTGYVEMPFVADAEEAVSELNGERIDGQLLSVKIVEAKEVFETTTEADIEEVIIEIEEEDEVVIPVPKPKPELRRKGMESRDD